MCKAMEDMRNESLQEGIKQGMRNAVIALKGVLNPEVIAERFKMPLDQVLEILGQS